MREAQSFANGDARAGAHVGTSASASASASAPTPAPAPASASTSGDARARARVGTYASVSGQSALYLLRRVSESTKGIKNERWTEMGLVHGNKPVTQGSDPETKTHLRMHESQQNHSHRKLID